MCARYAFFTGKITNDEVGVVPLPNLTPSWNYSPGKWAPVVAELMGNRMMIPMRWGLIPSWADPMNAEPRVNARAETAKEKPSFQAAFRSRRCLIPANGYYEWREEGKANQPYYISPSHPGETMMLAGLYEEHEGLQTFAVLTCDASEDLLKIHPRMPVILTGSRCRRWLDPTWGAGDKIPLGPLPVGSLISTPVDRRVGRTDVEGAELITPIKSPQGTLFDFNP